MKDFVTKNWFKIGLLIFLFISILGIRNYLDKKELIAENTATQKISLDKEKAMQDHETDRRKECFDIYKQESSKWNNTESFEYDPISDICYIAYKNSSAKSTDCSIWLPDTNQKDIKIKRSMMRDWVNCINGTTEKEF